MLRTDIKIIRMQCATIISSPKRFISFDQSANDKSRPINCVISFRPPEDFMKDLSATGIVKVNILHGIEKDFCTAFSCQLLAQFGYTNQKLEDIICELFEKHNL